MNTLNTTNSNKITSRLRRFAIGAVAAVAGLGLAGAGTAAAATTEAPAVAPAVEVPEEAAYEILATGAVIVEQFGLDIPHQIVGGYLLPDNTGVIELASGKLVDLNLYVFVPGFGGFGSANFDGMNYMGELTPLFDGGPVYEGDFESWLGTSMEITGLTIVPV